MKVCIFLFIFYFGSPLCYGQKRNAVWVFGDSAGIDFNSIISPSIISTAIDSRGSCVSIADSGGQLLFYAFNRMGQGDHSTRIYNSSHQIIQGGDTIVGEGVYNELTIVPMPGDSSKYYLFIATEVYPNNQGFYYCIVDMSQNNGNGRVIQKNIQLLNTHTADAVQAIKHGNGRDWWVLSKFVSSSSAFNRFFLYLITPSGIEPPIIQDFNNAADMGFVKIIFNPTFTKFMQVNLRGFMAEFDFDRCSGIISNSNVLFNEQSSNYDRTFWEGAYSSSGNMFYVSTSYYLPPADSGYLLQYNLLDPNPVLSCDTLDIWLPPIGTGALRLAPDEKIYFSRAYEWGFPGYPYPDTVYNQYNMNLSVINAPDSLGAACNYQPFSFYLGGKRTYYGLPNNPNYDLGPKTGSFCDTLPVAINEIESNNTQLHMFYHQGWKIAFINAEGLKGKKYIMQVSDVIGRIIYKESGDLTSQYYTYSLNMNSFADGIYVLSFITDREKLQNKFIKN